MKHFYRALLMLLVWFCAKVPLQAQHLDEVIFGNTTSETAHGLTTYNPAKVETYTGQQGQTAKRFLPDLTNPYQGSYVGIYGGEISFVLRVDGTKQNYFTVKFGGDEYNSGRILLNVEGKEIGIRAAIAGDEEVFMDKTQDGQVISQGAFFFRTVPLPRTLTDGKTSVLVRLRSSGRYYAYGTANVYSTYQRTLETASCGVYRAYVHTNPLLSLPSEDLLGSTPNYSTLSTTADNIATVRAGIIQKNEAKITSLLAGSNSIVTDPNNYFNNIEVLAEAYHRPDNSVAYHNAAVITKIQNAIDQHVVNYNNKTILESSSWGGAFGRSAYAAYLVYDQLTELDDVVDLGGGAGLTRRAQWLKIFKASFDFGVVNRRDAVTNQTMEAAMSVYGAALAMAKLDPATYAAFPAITYHHVLEACGIEPFTGAMTNLTSSNPTLGNPATSTKGEGFYFMTSKGTSHEPGWVSPDCYGNLAPKIMEFFYMTKKDPNITTYGTGKGDLRILEAALKHIKTQALFTYPSMNNGKRSILSEGVICWRNTYLPGEPFYGNAWVAAETKDPEAIGYIKQMVEDGKLSTLLDEDSKLTWLHFLPQALDTLINQTSNVKIPSSPNQPDYVAADEENGVIAIKNGTEQLFISLYSRAYSVNKLVKVHYISPVNERKIELRPDAVEYYRAGTGFATRATSASGPQSGEAPDKPQSAYGGQQEPYASYNRTNSYNTGRQLLDFYQVLLGKYLIGMNTTKDLTKTIVVPASFVGLSAYDISTGNTITLTANITLPPNTTKVYYISSVSDNAGLLADNTDTPSGVNKTSLDAKIVEMETFATSSTTVTNVSTLQKVGAYRYNLFDIFIQKLTLAKYASQYTNATQTQVNTALSELTVAYTNLISNPYDSVDPYERVEAESYSAQSGIQTETTGDIDGDRNLSFVGDGDYTRYNQLDFKEVGATKFYIRYAIPATGTSIEIRTGSVSGPLVGKIALAPTGGWQTWVTDSCKITGLKGVQDLFLVYKGAVNVNWFYFDSTAANYQSQVITFPSLPSATIGTADFSPNATASSGLAITYTSSNTSVATIVNGKIRIVGAGVSTITASQEGNWTYNAANDVVKTLVVTGIASGDYVSSGTMNWNGGTWRISDGNGGYSGTTTTVPSTTTNVHILSGHTVTLATTAGNCKNLIVQSGGVLTETIALTVAGSMIMDGTLTNSQAVSANGDLAIAGTWTMSNNLTTAKNVSISSLGILRGSTTAGGTVQSLNIGGANTTISIDGQLGGASTGASGESIRMYTTGSGTITFTGSGKVFLARFQPNSTSAQSIIMDVDMNFNNFNSSPTTGFTLMNNGASSNTKSFTINAGKVLKLTHANCGFHSVYNASTAPTTQAGDMIYNVNGTLDVSAASFIFYSTNNSTYPSPIQNLMLNVGSSGVLKLGRNIRMLKAMTTQTVAINVANGGVIDGSSYALNLTTAPVSSNGTSTDNSVWFSLAPNATYKQLVSANVVTPLWIGTSNSSYNPVVVTPTTETVFTVGVKEGNVPAGLLVPSKALNRTWTVTPVISSATNLQFAYNDNQGNTDFSPTASVQLMNYNTNNSTWEKASSLIVPQTASLTNRVVSFSGVNTFGSFTLSNDFVLPQTISFNTLPNKYINDADFEAGASASSGLSISYVSSNPAVATIIDGKIHLVSAGTTTITASQAGNETYNSAAEVSQVLTVNKKSQTITFNSLSTKTLGDANFEAGASSSSGLTISYMSSNPAIATIIDGKIHLVGAGITTITASQSGNETYNSAAEVSQVLTVNKKSQSITFNSLSTKTLGDADFEAGASASSSLTISYMSSNPTVATIVDGKIHLVGAGTTTITASQVGNEAYNSAAEVSQVLTVNKKSQTITFNSLSTKTLGDADFEAGASVSSSLTISYVSSNPAVATIVEGKIHLVGAGTTTITASQAGNEAYNSATEVSQVLTVLNPVKLSVKYQNADNGSNNNIIRPYLVLYNEGNVSVNYSDLTIRYWLTPENYTGINSWIDYAQLGNNNVKMKYVPLSSPRNGALGYMEYSFATSAGTLSPSTNSGVIQSRFANTDWANLNEIDDYSYSIPVNGNTFNANDHITIYKNGQLVYGIEPTEVLNNKQVKVYLDSKSNATSNTISSYLKIDNTGNTPLNYQDLKVRYWFTKEGNSPLNFFLDYAKLGSSNITSQFVPLTNIRSGADTYLELGMSPNLGVFYPLSTTENIQYRIAKSDWSAFNQSDDFSYTTDNKMSLTNKVSVYYQDQLIYGEEPATISANAARTTAESNPWGLEINLLGNPIVDDQCRFSLKGVNGKPLSINLFSSTGNMLTTQDIFDYQEEKVLTIPFDQYQQGVYLLKITSLNQSVVVKIMK